MDWKYWYHLPLSQLYPRQTVSVQLQSSKVKNRINGKLGSLQFGLNIFTLALLVPSVANVLFSINQLSIYVAMLPPYRQEDDVTSTRCTEQKSLRLFLMLSVLLWLLRIFIPRKSSLADGIFVLFLFKLHQFVLPAWGVPVVFPLITLPGEVESRAGGLVPYCYICVNSLKWIHILKDFM